MSGQMKKEYLTRDEERRRLSNLKKKRQNHRLHTRGVFGIQQRINKESEKLLVLGKFNLHLTLILLLIHADMRPFFSQIPQSTGLSAGSLGSPLKT
jgi:hypothetical protein